MARFTTAASKQAAATALPPAPSHQERGFALLIVLWTVVLLALLVTYLTAAGRSEAQLASNLRVASVMEAAADGAVADAIFHLLDSSNRHWQPDGSVRRMRMPGAIIDLKIDNEAGKIDLNTVQPALLQALLHVTGLDSGTSASIAGAVVDWRFPDAQNRPGGAKAAQYRNAGRTYGPPGEPFQTLDELGLVLGVTPTILANVAPYLSVYHDGEPDLRYAALQVRQALRESTGAEPTQKLGPPDERVVRITAAAMPSNKVGADAAGSELPDGGNGLFIRRAMVRIGSRVHGGLFEILTWDIEHG